MKTYTFRIRKRTYTVDERLLKRVALWIGIIVILLLFRVALEDHSGSDTKKDTTLRIAPVGTDNSSKTPTYDFSNILKGKQNK
jgi:hypothetical protein